MNDNCLYITLPILDICTVPISYYCQIHQKHHGILDLLSFKIKWPPCFKYKLSCYFNEKYRHSIITVLSGIYIFIVNDWTECITLSWRSVKKILIKY